MRWVRDATGRFPRRPHYEPRELDAVCDDLLKGQQLPLSTDALTVLIEQRAADLDLYADLSFEGTDVEAVTDFVPGQKPRVRISERLSTVPRRAHRFRTTLAHELAHVVFHDFIWWFDQGLLSADRARALSPRCHRRMGVQQADWMEWQANYAAGALLMPAGAVRELLGAAAPLWARSETARQRVRDVAHACEISTEAARVRLEQLGLLTRRPLHVVRAPVPVALLKRR